MRLPRFTWVWMSTRTASASALHRALVAQGYSCEVIAPSQMPRRAGDRVKTDGRDCIQLAEAPERGNCERSGFPSRPTRRCATYHAHARASAATRSAGSEISPHGYANSHGMRNCA